MIYSLQYMAVQLIIIFYYVAGLIMVPFGLVGILNLYEVNSAIGTIYIIILLAAVIVLWNKVVITDNGEGHAFIMMIICLASIVLLGYIGGMGDYSICFSIAWIPLSLGFKSIFETAGEVEPVRGARRQKYSAPVPVDPLVECSWTFDRIFRAGKVIFHNPDVSYTDMEKRHMEDSVPLSLQLKYRGYHIDLQNPSDERIWWLNCQQETVQESDSSYALQYENTEGRALVTSRVQTGKVLKVQYTLDIQIDGYTLRFLAEKE